jgi:DNA-binding NtrC family response regulator
MEHPTQSHTRSQRVLFVSGDPAEGTRMTSLLEESGYLGEALGAIEELEAHLARGAFLAVILDLDSLAVDNPSMRRLAQRFSEVCFFCSSRTNYHPELQEAIRMLFFACLPRPVNPDELAYWLRCASEHAEENRGPP